MSLSNEQLIMLDALAYYSAFSDIQQNWTDDENAPTIKDVVEKIQSSGGTTCFNNTLGQHRTVAKPVKTWYIALFSDYCTRPMKKLEGKTCRDVGRRKKHADKQHCARYPKKKMAQTEFQKRTNDMFELHQKALD